MLDQFNEMTAAALVLNGFVQDFYDDGEVVMQNGNSVSNLGNQLIQALGTLGTANFDSAKLIAKLAIAQQAIGEDQDQRRSGSRRFMRSGN